MFIGHFAVGFASKRLAPRTSMGWLVLAPLFLDALWPIGLATGLERVHIEPGNTVVMPLRLEHYPWTHSLAMAAVWSLLFGAVYWGATRERRGAVVLGVAVLSHFVLDWVTHRPDLPLWPGGSARIGLGLWNSLPGTLGVECAMLALGVWLYARTTRARRRAGDVHLAVMVVVLLALYAGNVFGPPPPSVNAIIGLTFGFYLFLPWAWIMDRAREVRRG